MKIIAEFTITKAMLPESLDSCMPVRLKSIEQYCAKCLIAHAAQASGIKGAHVTYAFMVHDLREYYLTEDVSELVSEFDTYSYALATGQRPTNTIDKWLPLTLEMVERDNYFFLARKGEFNVHAIQG